MLENAKKIINNMNFVGIGTNRIVYSYPDTKLLIKFPLSKLGLIANKEEYNNFLNNKNIVAYCFLYKNLLLQEKLKNVKIFSLQEVKSGVAIQWILDTYKEDGKKFINKLQYHKCSIGLNEKNEIKLYDYENVKSNLRFYRQFNIDINVIFTDEEDKYFKEYLLNVLDIKDVVFFDEWMKVNYPIIYNQRKL